MAKRVSFSDQDLGLEEIAVHYDSLISSLREYYSPNSPSFLARCSSYTNAEVEDELSRHIAEIDLTSALNVMSATEAALRVDYLDRAYRRGKDKLSRAMRDVYQTKSEKASLEDDIIAAWTATGIMKNQLAGDLKSAYRYRHWLAHGRYWTLKIGRKYDFFSLYIVAGQVFDLIDQTS